jgi:hypothetical protein
MGTRGYHAFRYRNFYFAYYHHYDGYPRGLGIHILSCFRHWPDSINTLRQKLQGILHDLREFFYDQYGSVDEGMGTISRERPRYGVVDAEWIYEIDLDNEIFHVNGIPCFDLKCLPNDEAFLKFVDESTNHYDNVSCPPECPPEHKYKCPAPSAVTDSMLATYQSLVCTGTHVALSDLLTVSDIMTPNEHVRVSLLETMIGQCMSDKYVAPILFEIELADNQNELTNDQWSTACSMANIAFAPQIFDKSSRFLYHPELHRTEFTWVREDTVLFIATHLDDERWLQFSISRLIDAILRQKDDPDDYFGVSFSVHHCVVVKVVKGEHTTTFSHTGALQFLPSFYADSPSTPGITALARLAYRVDPALFLRALKFFQQQPPRRTWSIAPPPSTSCSVLPVELWREIALHLHVHDLLAFGLVSKTCREVASMILHYPHVCGYRLVAIPKEQRLLLSSARAFPCDLHSLHAAAFFAVQAGVPATVLVGFSWVEEEVLFMDIVLGKNSLLSLQVPFAVKGVVSERKRYWA